MLSILIPTYHYNVYPLALIIEQQALNAGIVFELICMDDGSFSHFNVENQNINTLTHCKFIEAKKNRGRTAMRQKLAEQAQYDWLLFLDADVMPKNQNYISDYVKMIKSNYEAVYGGFAYQNKPPNIDDLLRWTYGKSKEEVPADIRNEKPYKIVISANFLIKKEMFIFINTHIHGNSYGYDNYFGALLKEHRVKVYHIDNEVYHLGIEKSSEYLKKTEQAVETLLILYKNGAIKESDNDLLKMFITLKSFGIHRLIARLFKKNQKQLANNLTGTNPSIMKLQIYKLGYICYKDLN